MSNELVFYHAGCFDGFCAAWLFKQAFPDAEFHAAHYGTEPPIVAGRRVFVADFCYKRPVMERIHANAVTLTVLDHHKTAQADLDGFAEAFPCEVIFDMDKSGGRLVWEYLYGRRSLPDSWLTTSKSGYSLGVAPWLVDYTEDRDLWAWKLPSSREVNAALRSYPMDFTTWNEMNKWHPNRLAAEGAAILRREKQIVDDHVGFAREIDMDGYQVLCVNATVLSSEIAEALAAGRPFGVCWFERADGKKIYSLRSREGGIDVSEIAKAHGGGGHRNAAGFEE